MNECHLSCVITKEDVLRYTPAGLPVLRCWYFHQSQLPNGRRIQCEGTALLMGYLAADYQGKLLQKKVVLHGFLSQQSLKRAHLVLHVESLEEVLP